MATFNLDGDSPKVRLLHIFSCWFGFLATQQSVIVVAENVFPVMSKCQIFGFEFELMKVHQKIPFTFTESAVNIFCYGFYFLCTKYSSGSRNSSQ